MLERLFTGLKARKKKLRESLLKRIRPDILSPNRLRFWSTRHLGGGRRKADDKQDVSHIWRGLTPATCKKTMRAIPLRLKRLPRRVGSIF